MTALARFFLITLRPFLVTALAFFVLSVSSAHVRETVMVKLQENGVQRFYETEALHHSGTEVRHAQLKMGRKPLEAQAPLATRVEWPVERPHGRPAMGPASPRAPPHQPRAPPIA